MAHHTPCWLFDLKVDPEVYDREEHGVVGNFDLALRNLIQGVKEGRTGSDLLYEWDKTRGNDWYTQTNLELFGSHKEIMEED